MSALRTTLPLLRRTTPPLSSLSSRALSRPTRALNTSSAPTLYSAHATAIGARTGRIRGETLSLQLTMAKALGGAGDAGKTNPEELLAGGFGACFQSAMNACALQLGYEMPARAEDSVVETTVHLVGDMKALDMGLRLDMRVAVKGMGRERLERVVSMAREVCPYCRAVKGNVDVRVQVEEME